MRSDHWIKTKLSFLIDTISETYKFRSDTKVVLINTSDILEGKVNNHLKIFPENVAGQFKKTFRKNDILYSEIRPDNKRYAYIDFESKNYVASTKLMVLRKKNELVDNQFIYQLLKSNDTLSKLQVIAESRSGTFPQITFTELSNLEINLPSLKEQKAIASILSSLDDKIELNNKINKNLEEMAQALYKRWFVDFEFPNEDGEPYKSSGGEMVESELGLIPKGWEVESIGESSISKLISSGIKEFNGTKKYIATADVTNLSITSFVTEIDFKKRPSRANMQPIAGSLWFAKMKDSRKMIRVSKSSRYLIDKCILSTGFAGLFAPKYSNYIWTILTTKDFDDTKNNLCNGTTMQAINNENINRIKILIPDTKTLDLFESISEPIFEKIQFNEMESNKLAKSRDELLPKLMNGEIEVPIEE